MASASQTDLPDVHWRELSKCAGRHERYSTPFAGFLYWCVKYVKIQDKETHQAIPFKLYECQQIVAEKLFSGLWLWILKARQLGMTWLMAAYVLWKCTFEQMVDVAAMSQDREYAAEFLKRVIFIRDHLPEWMRPEITADSTFRLEFNAKSPTTGKPHGCAIRSLAASEKTARSLTADVVFFDEASRIPFLSEARQAAEPTLEIGNGQMIGLTTSRGPGNDFHDVWYDEYSKFENIFFPWSAHPKRDTAWFETEKKAHAAQPMYMKQEFPETPEEAFESPAGRIFPVFSRRRNCRQLEIQPEWPRYRAIDWGAVHPFVCLWVVVVPASPPSLTYDPALVWFPRQMIGYKWREGVTSAPGRRIMAEEPQKDQDDCCDAIRYLICHYMMNAHVHVYREHVVPDSAQLGKDTPRLAQEVAALSSGEKYVGGVADSSRQDNILTFVLNNVKPLSPYQHPWSESPRGRVSDGIDRVNSLIVGTPYWEPKVKQDPLSQRILEIRGGLIKKRPGTITGLADRLLTERAMDEIYGPGQWKKRDSVTANDPDMVGLL